MTTLLPCAGAASVGGQVSDRKLQGGFGKQHQQLGIWVLICLAAHLSCSSESVMQQLGHFKLPVAFPEAVVLCILPRRQAIAADQAVMSLLLVWLLHGAGVGGQTHVVHTEKPR